MPKRKLLPGNPNARNNPLTVIPATAMRRQAVAGAFSFLGSIEYTEIAVLLVTFIFVSIFEFIPDGPLRAGRDWLFDTYQILYPAQRDTSSTVIVEIDEASIRRIGPWPWPRDKLAALVDAGRDARAIGLDILLPDADRLSPDRLVEELHIDAALRQSLLRLPDPDSVLATALRSSPTVLAMMLEDGMAENGVGKFAISPVTVAPVRERGEGAGAAIPQAGSVRWPLALLADAARGIGIVSALRGRSGKIDRLPAVVAVGGSILPSFGLELVRIALKAETLVLNASAGVVSSVTVGGLTIRTDASGEVRPRFIGTDRLVRIPAYRLIDPLSDRSALRDRIVVIGVTARGVGETFLVPAGIQESSAAIQAELIESVMAGDTLWRPYWAPVVECIAALLVGLAVVLLMGRISYRAYVAVFVGIVPLLVGTSVVLFRTRGWLLDCVLPLSCLFVTGFVIISVQIRTEVATRRRRDAELAVALVQQSAEHREALLRSEAEALRQNLTFAVDAARLGVWDADLQGGVWHHSPRHDAILGLVEAPPRWSVALLLDRVVAEDLAMVRNHFAAAEASGTLQLECQIRWPDATLHHIHILGRFWRDPDGTPSRVAGVVADITQQRNLEHRLRQGEKMQAVGLLAGGVAHNFNNLLTVVLGSLELVRGKLDLSPDARPLIAAATAASRKCADIVRQLLAFARLQPLRSKSVDPVYLLHTVYQLLRTALPERVEMHLETPSELGEIKIDPVEFELALLNLAMNARDAMPNGGRLVINGSCMELLNSGLGPDGHYLVIEVSDNGEGIAPDMLQKVFEPFFTTKEVGKGTGLGLSQVHGFARQSGGAVEIESTPGQGTRVRLYLPSSETITRPVRSLDVEVSR